MGVVQVAQVDVKGAIQRYGLFQQIPVLESFVSTGTWVGQMLLLAHKAS